MNPNIQTELNHKTGSTFYIIGHTDMLSLSFRLWKETAPIKGVTSFGFRVRVSPKSGGPAILNFMEYLGVEFPEVQWMGQSTSHASISGIIKVPVSQYQAEACLQRLKDDMVDTKLWDMMHNVFGKFDFVVTAETFSEMFWEIATEEFGIGKEDENLQTASIFQFGEAKKELPPPPQNEHNNVLADDQVEVDIPDHP